MSALNRRIIWSTTDYKGRYVEFSASTQSHILKGHPEMVEMMDMVKATIEAPEMVVLSQIFADTEIHSIYGQGHKRLRNKWLHVPVQYQVGLGSVKTAYLSATTKPGKVIFARMKK